MVDGVKLCLTNQEDIDRILESELIPFRLDAYYHTGEAIEYPLKCKKGSMQYTIFSPNCMEIKGSLHKFFAHGVNHTDFAFSNIQEAINDFCSFLQVEPSKLNIQNLEFGVNVITDFSPTDILRDVICYKNRMPINPINDKKGYLIEFKVDGYYFKMYDKGKQYKLKENLLRVELKGMTNRFFTESGISSMADLTKRANLLALQDKLMSLYRHVVFDDSGLDICELNTCDRKVYEPLQNPKLWVKNKGSKRQAILAQERRFKGIVSQWGKYGHFEVVKELIQAKCSKLINS